MKTASTTTLKMEKWQNWNYPSDKALFAPWRHRELWLCENNFLILSGFQTDSSVVDKWKSAFTLRTIIFGKIYPSEKLNPKQF